MKYLLLTTLALTGGLAAAKETSPLTVEVVSVAPDEVRTLGRVNVNSATRDQLVAVPGLDAERVDVILRERAKAPIHDLGSLHLMSEEALSHLKTQGSSDLRRIRQLPLVRIGEATASR
jgi:DNA uptake protein ComE-like DNA-binding protein